MWHHSAVQEMVRFPIYAVIHNNCSAQWHLKEETLIEQTRLVSVGDERHAGRRAPPTAQSDGSVPDLHVAKTTN